MQLLSAVVSVIVETLRGETHQETIPKITTHSITVANNASNGGDQHNVSCLDGTILLICPRAASIGLPTFALFLHHGDHEDGKKKKHHMVCFPLIM